MDPIGFSEENDCSTWSFDDLQMIRMKKNPARRIRLSNTPNLNYLNLLDYEDKRGDFLSNSFIYRCISVLEGRNLSEKTFKKFDKYASASLFCFYVNYMKNIPKDSIDLQALDRVISHVIRNLEHCDKQLLRYAVFDEIFNLHSALRTEKLLLPIILKRLCTTEGLITYAFEYFFTTCNARLFRELLDVCIDSPFDFWTICARKKNLDTIPFCPVTYAYFHEKLDFLRVLLDYGFQQTHQRVPALEMLLPKLIQSQEFHWSLSQPYIIKFNQSSRIRIVSEVLLFVVTYLDSSRRPDVFAKCFQLAWDAQNEPYVTKHELLNAFDYIVRVLVRIKESELNERRLWFEERLDAYQTLLPDYQEALPQPRSLKHQCRCTVRKALIENRKMPRGVAKLSIPEALKSYILLR